MMLEERSNALRKLLCGVLCLGAAAWPWGAYGQLYDGCGVFSGVLAALLLALVVSWARSGRPSVPFDLLWPALLIIVGVALSWVAGNGGASPAIIVGCIAFLLALFAATDQTLVLRALAASALSAGGVAVLTVLAEFNKVFPTFFAQQGGAVGAGPTNLVDALFLFSWSASVACALFLGRRHRLSGGVAWLLPVAALACGTAFWFLARRLQNDLHAWTPNYGALAFPMFPLVLLSLYLASRVAARVFVLAGPRPQALLAGLLLVYAFLCAVTGYFPSTGLCFSFGLIAALGVQRTLRNPDAAKTGLVWLLVIPVLAAHAVTLFPGDARDYVLQAQRLSKESGVQAARDYLALVLSRFPGESRARLEFAKIELESGQIDAATDNFIGAVCERRASHVWGQPDQGSVAEFLSRVKQLAENTPGIAYERCLVGVGKAQEAVEVLKGRVKTGPSVNIDSEPLRRALISLMGGDESGSYFNDWTAAELVSGLNLCGTYCQAVQAPAEVPRRLLPVVLATRPLQDRRMVSVFYAGGQLGRSWLMPPCSGQTPGEGEALWLEPVLDADTGECYLPLAGAADVIVGDEMRIVPTEDAQIDCGPGAGGWAVICLLP